VFIDEYVAKVDRIAAKRGADLRAQVAATAAASEDRFWSSRLGRSNDEPHPLWQPGDPEPKSFEGVDVDPELVASQLEEDDAESSRGRGLLVAGASVLGVGAVVLGVGAGITAGGSFAGMFVITAGALGVVAGLVLLIVGAVLTK
jgi:hypothetical protein